METSPRKHKIEGIDRISSLPDDIIHNILSSLCILDVVKLSVLSKKWEYICTTMPYLDFDIIQFRSGRINRGTVEKFKDFINWVLISNAMTEIVRFKVICKRAFGEGADEEVILRWIHATTRRNVQELVLSIHLSETFELPYCLSTCESLQVLKLDLSEAILVLPNHLGFRQLKLLHLVNVELPDEHLTNCLFAKCPVLENLILKDCCLGAMTVLNIASTSLIHVTLHNCWFGRESYNSYVLKICCPNLRFLKYNAEMPKDIIMENLFRVEVIHIFFQKRNDMYDGIGILVHKMIRGVPSTSVLKLSLDSVWSMHNVAHEVRLSPVLFYKLKSLKVTVEFDEAGMQVLMLLLKHSPNLEVLKLIRDEDFCESDELKLHLPDESILCLESRLKSIQLTDFKADKNEIELLRFFLKNARVLEKLMIVWDYCFDETEPVVEVLEFPSASSRVALTFQDYSTFQNAKARKTCSSRF